MPRISDHILDSTFYLYPDVASAKAGKSMGGTGFLVAYLLNHRVSSDPHVYAITNWHVAVRGGNSVIRINRHDGTPAIFDFDVSDWQFMPEGDDVAALRIDLNPEEHKFGAIHISDFASKEHLKWEIVGTGDDVFMVGRFVDHDGGETNKPAARFGNISMLPMPIKIEETGRERDYYCVDMHSRTGFSGSPVFTYRPIGSDLTGDDLRKIFEKVKSNALCGFDIPFWDFRPYMGLLGIHCGQFPEELELKKKSRGKDIRKREWVIGMSGMTLVAPSWAILEVLEHPALQKERAAIDAANPGADRLRPVFEYRATELTAAPVPQTKPSPQDDS